MHDAQPCGVPDRSKNTSPVIPVVSTSDICHVGLTHSGQISIVSAASNSDNTVLHFVFDPSIHWRITPASTLHITNYLEYYAECSTTSERCPQSSEIVRARDCSGARLKNGRLTRHGSGNFRRPQGPANKARKSIVYRIPYSMKRRIKRKVRRGLETVFVWMSRADHRVRASNRQSGESLSTSASIECIKTMLAPVCSTV